MQQVNLVKPICAYIESGEWAISSLTKAPVCTCDCVTPEYTRADFVTPVNTRVHQSRVDYLTPE